MPPASDSKEPKPPPRPRVRSWDDVMRFEHAHVEFCGQGNVISWKVFGTQSRVTPAIREQIAHLVWRLTAGPRHQESRKARQIRYDAVYAAIWYRTGSDLQGGLSSTSGPLIAEGVVAVEPI